MIILFSGEKGGSGKSTLAVQIGIERVKHGHPALIIDSDPQATAKNWINRRTIQPLINCIEMKARDFYRRIPELLDEYEDIIIDIAGRDSEEMRCALGFVDIVVFPVRPTMNDLETAQRVDELVGQILTVTNHIKKAFFVLSQAPPNPFRTSTNKDAIDYLTECENIATSPVVICSRSAYERASIEGVSVSELNPTATKAKKELSQLYKEIFSDDSK